MAKIEIDLEAVREVGWLCGVLVNAFVEGYEEGLQDFDFVKAENDIKDIHEKEVGLERPAVKTEIGDCRKCWCDQCAKLEECVHIREGELPDGIRPFPCIGCDNGLRFMPCEAERCADFVQGEGLNNG